MSKQQHQQEKKTNHPNNECYFSITNVVLQVLNEYVASISESRHSMLFADLPMKRDTLDTPHSLLAIQNGYPA